MEDNNKIIRYWFYILGRARKIAFKESDIKGWIIGLMIAAILFGCVDILVFLKAISPSTPYVGDVANNLRIQIGLGIASFIIFAIAFFFALVYVPAKVYDELGGFAENPFKLAARPPLEKLNSENRWASIDVENITRLTIEKCFITIDNISDSRGDSNLERQRRLLWSAGEGRENIDKELDVVINVPRVCDVATTYPSNQGIQYTTWNGGIPGESGISIIKITAHGLWKGQQVEKQAEFEIEYIGGNVLTIIEKGKSKWENSNPHKPGTRRRSIYHPPSIKSST